MNNRWEWLETAMAGVSGTASCWFRDLETGETFGWQEEAVHSSASIIKIFLMAFLFRKFRDGLQLPDVFNDRLAGHRSEAAADSGNAG